MLTYQYFGFHKIYATTFYQDISSREYYVVENQINACHLDVNDHHSGLNRSRTTPSRRPTYSIGAKKIGLQGCQAVVSIRNDDELMGCNQGPWGFGKVSLPSILHFDWQAQETYQPKATRDKKRLHLLASISQFRKSKDRLGPHQTHNRPLNIHDSETKLNIGSVVLLRQFAKCQCESWFYFSQSI